MFPGYAPCPCSQSSSWCKFKPGGISFHGTEVVRNLMVPGCALVEGAGGEGWGGRLGEGKGLLKR